MSSYIKGEITEEILYKVNNISNKLIYSFSGDVSRGHNFANILKQALENSGIRNAIKIAVNSCTPQNKNNQFMATLGLEMDPENRTAA